jgi:tRNA-modifying protein YgfZ
MLSPAPAHQHSSDTVRALIAGLGSACAVTGPEAGLLRVTGADRLDFLHRLSTNALLGMKSGQAVLTVFTNEKGRIVDAAVALVRPEDILLICSGPSHEALCRWLGKFIIMDDVQVEDLTPAYRLLSIFGPAADRTAGALLGASLAPGSFLEADTSWGRAIAVLIQRPGTLHAGILVTTPDTPAATAALAAHVPVATGMAAEAVRIAFGIPWAPQELCGAYTPYDAGLRHAISFTKGCYVGQEVIARLDAYQKIRRGLYGVLVRDAGNALHGPVPLFAGEIEAGAMTSVTRFGDGGIGLAVVEQSVASPGTLSIGAATGERGTARLAELPLAASELAAMERL